jgi:hypothetical protein
LSTLKKPLAIFSQWIKKIMKIKSFQRFLESKRFLFNPTILTLKSYYKLLFAKPSVAYEFKLPLLIATGFQRSGTSLITQLLRNHPQLLTYYSELHIGRPNKYFWPDLTSYSTSKERFKQLIPKNHAKKFWRIRSPKSVIKDNFLFDFALFKKNFLKLDKNSSKQRETLDAFFTGYFSAYLNYNYNNLFENYKFIHASIPGLTRYKESVKAFFNDYPNGFLLVMIRNPFQWYNSAKHHSKEFAEKGLALYEDHLKNCLWCASKYERKFIIVSFEDLIEDVEGSMKIVCSLIGIEFCDVVTYPSNFPYSGIDNSTFGKSPTNKVIKEKLKRKIELTDDESDYITRKIIHLYDKLMANKAVNRST